MDEDQIPDFLQVNGFGVRRGMFGAPRQKPSVSPPFFAPTPGVVDPSMRALDPLFGAATPPPSSFNSWRFPPPVPAAALCPLVPLKFAAGSVAANGADLRFSPMFADVVRKAADTLNKQGLRLNVSEGFRTAADQWRMRHGGSGTNPAAEYSDHQLGNGIDINGTKLSSFPLVVQAFKQAGAKWGGDYRGKKDHPHFYIRPVRANALNTAECERGNPR